MWHHKGSVTCLGCPCPSSPTAGSSGDRGVWNSRIPLYFTHPTWGRTAQLSAPGQESLLSCWELGDPPCLLNSRGGKGTGKKGKKKRNTGEKGREEKKKDRGSSSLAEICRELQGWDRGVVEESEQPQPRGIPTAPRAALGAVTALAGSGTDLGGSVTALGGSVTALGGTVSHPGLTLLGHSWWHQPDNARLSLVTL